VVQPDLQHLTADPGDHRPTPYSPASR
jgi:hypothetical protein